MNKIAVIGAGSWATALAHLLAGKNYRVRMWARNNSVIEEINKQHSNSRYLPGIKINTSIEAADDIGWVLEEAEMVVSGVPSHAFRDTLLMCKEFLGENSRYVNTAKGFDQQQLKRLSEVYTEIMPPQFADNFAVLSGPSHAEEVVKGVPTAVVAASASRKSAEYVQDMFIAPAFRVYTNPDIVGVETGGALKNIIALGTGISDGLGLGDNTKAALITRGLTEISRLGIKMGAEKSTFAGLSGIGDLIVTCTSNFSRNRQTGIAIGRGLNIADAVASTKMVVEGVKATEIAYLLAQKYDVEMPITAQMYDVLFNGKSPQETIVSLMGRGRKHEIEEAVREHSTWE